MYIFVVEKLTDLEKKKDWTKTW